MRSFLIVIILSLLLNYESKAHGSECQNLEKILHNQEFADLSKETLLAFKKGAVWSADYDLVAFCSDAHCFVVKTCANNLKIIDVSRVIRANLGYFGINPAHQRIENLPLFISNNEAAAIRFWHDIKTHTSDVDDPSMFGAVIQTRIWNNGQRYTTSEPMLFKNDVWQGR